MHNSRSLNPPQFFIWHQTLKYRHQLYNKTMRQKKMDEVSLEEYARFRDFDLSGKKIIDVNKLP